MWTDFVNKTEAEWKRSWC